MKLVKEMGSDLCINAFAVNFRVNGQDVIEANDLNTRIFERLSISKMEDAIHKRPLILTSTKLSQRSYASCLTTFKKRLGLVGDQDLYTLINVVSSPFPTDGNFTAQIAGALQEVIEEEVKISQFRNTITPTFHGFVMQSTDEVYLTHIPMFSMADHRYQLIITGDLPASVKEKYVAARKEHPGQYFTLANANAAILTDMVAVKEFEAVIDIGMPPSQGPHSLSGFKLTNVRVIKEARLDSKYLTSYPTKSVPFYLYGTGKQFHIDHALLASPTIQLNSDCVKLDLAATIVIGASPLVVHLQLPERAMQPFPSNEDIAKTPSFFFKPQAKFDVVVTKDLSLDLVVAKGTLQLSDIVFIDTDMLNMNPRPEAHTKDEQAADEAVGLAQGHTKIQGTK